MDAALPGTTIMDLHKRFNLAEDWGVTQRTYEGVNQKPLKIRQKINFGLIIGV